MSSGLVIWVRVGSDTEQAVALLKARPEVTEALPVDHKLKVTLASHDTDHSVIADTLGSTGGEAAGTARG